MFAGQDEQARENMRKERRRIQVRSHLQYFANTYCYFVTMHYEVFRRPFANKKKLTGCFYCVFY